MSSLIFRVAVLLRRHCPQCLGRFSDGAAAFLMPVSDQLGRVPKPA
jgi:hypothetical protein